MCIAILVTITSHGSAYCLEDSYCLTTIVCCLEKNLSRNVNISHKTCVFKRNVKQVHQAIIRMSYLKNMAALRQINEVIP